MNDDELHRHFELDELAEALASMTPGGEVAVLVGWVAVAEYSDANGRRWLAVRSGAAPDSDHATTSWQRRGYLEEVINSDWTDAASIDLEDEGDDD